MKAANPRRQRLLALAVCGALLLDPPLLFSVGGWWHGLPSIVVYLFGVWALLLLAAAWLVERGEA